MHKPTTTLAQKQFYRRKSIAAIHRETAVLLPALFLLFHYYPLKNPSAGVPQLPWYWVCTALLCAQVFAVLPRLWQLLRQPRLATVYTVLALSHRQRTAIATSTFDTLLREQYIRTHLLIPAGILLAATIGETPLWSFDTVAPILLLLPMILLLALKTLLLYSGKGLSKRDDTPSGNHRKPIGTHLFTRQSTFRRALSTKIAPLLPATEQRIAFRYTLQKSLDQSPIPLFAAFMLLPFIGVLIAILSPNMSHSWQHTLHLGALLLALQALVPTLTEARQKLLTLPYFALSSPAIDRGMQLLLVLVALPSALFMVTKGLIREGAIVLLLTVPAAIFGIQFWLLRQLRNKGEANAITVIQLLLLMVLCAILDALCRQI